MNPGEPMPDKKGFTLACGFLMNMGWGKVAWSNPTHNEREHPEKVAPTKLRFWKDEFYLFDGRVYNKLADSELDSKVMTFCNFIKYFDSHMVPRNTGITNTDVNNIRKQLSGICYVNAKSMPVWLDADKRERPDPLSIISFNNGLLNLDDWYQWPETLPEPATELWFSENILPRDYIADAQCPASLKFFHEVLGDNEQVSLLQEWMGYLLTRETRMQKMLWLHGVGGGGKGTIARLMEELVGKENAVSFGLFDLCERFTLSSFISKTLAVSHDARLGQSSDAQKVVEQVLSIAGEDDRQVDRKNKDLLPNIRLRTRLVVCVNGFPHLPDAGIALKRRSIVLSFRKTFSDKPDPYLQEKLREELPGLTVWAMEGLRRLNSRGQFRLTSTAEEMLDRLGRLSSPLRAFIDECCVIGPTFRTLKRQLFRTWQEWAKANGHRPMASNSFCERIYESEPGISPVRCRDGGKRIQCIVGIRLSLEGARFLPESELGITIDEEADLQEVSIA